MKSISVFILLATSSFLFAAKPSENQANEPSKGNAASQEVAASVGVQVSPYGGGGYYYPPYCPPYYGPGYYGRGFSFYFGPSYDCYGYYYGPYWGRRYYYRGWHGHRGGGHRGGGHGGHRH